MIRFIDEYRDRYGVEFLCRTLRAAVRGFITSLGYRAAKTRTPSARKLREALLIPEVQRLHKKHYSVYGRRKMHALINRNGWEIGRDQTERLMKIAGLRGVQRSKRVFTTKSNPADRLPCDLVNRNFTATGPKCLWARRYYVCCDVAWVRLCVFRYRRILTKNCWLERRVNPES